MTKSSNKMGIITTTITVSNLVDEILAERGFTPKEQIRSITLDNVLVDIGATRLCLPANIIAQLGLPHFSFLRKYRYEYPTYRTTHTRKTGNSA